MLGTGRLPGDIVGTLSDRFRVTGEEGGGLSLWRLGQGKGSTPYLVTSPLGWTKPQVWSASLCYVSSETERCTSCNLSTPSRLVVILHKGVYYILLGISPRGTPPSDGSPRGLISDTAHCLCHPKGGTPSKCRRDPPLYLADNAMQ